MIPLFSDDVPEEHRKAVAALYLLDEWPQDWGKDVEMVRRLAAMFPDVDLTAEAIHFATWLEGWREKHPRKEVKHRARFVNWVKNSRRFAGRRAKPPAPRAAHGETRVEGW